MIMPDQQLDIEEVYDKLRRAILERLRQEVNCITRKHDKPQIIEHREIQYLLPDYPGFACNQDQIGALICQIYHELYLERIIIPGESALSPRSMNPMSWPWYRITEHGKRFLQASEYSPYDPDGYLHRLKLEIPKVDETIIRYIEESLKCLRTDCLLAAAVTIGCASENAMLLLIEQFGQAITDPKKKQEYEIQTSNWIISRKYRFFRNSLDSVAKDLPKDLRDPLEQQLHGAFDLIRRIRNDAGHPTGDPITRDMAVASHILFPGYCKYVYSLIDHFAEHSVRL
jgi:hypothetical protein